LAFSLALMDGKGRMSTMARSFSTSLPTSLMVAPAS